jgi:hypothetical protein
LYSATFRDVLALGANTCEGPIVIKLVEETAVVSAILNALRNPLQELARTPDHWTFEEAEAEHAAAEKYMLDRYMSMFHHRIIRAAQCGPFQALVWAIQHEDQLIASEAISAFASVASLQLGPGQKQTKTSPVHWTINMINAIGIRYYRQILRLVMSDLLKRQDGDGPEGVRTPDWERVSTRFIILHDGREDDDSDDDGSGRCMSEGSNLDG